MPVLDAKRNAAKSAAGFAFAWPLVLAAGCVFLPLWVIFDLIPKGVTAIGRGVVAGATTAGPVALAPVVKWVTLPLEREIVAETALALEARADAGEGPEAPLVPDSIAMWSPPTGMSLRTTAAPRAGLGVRDHRRNAGATQGRIAMGGRTMIFWLLILLGYLIMGAGTARFALKRFVKRELEHGHAGSYNDADIVVPTFLCGLFWPFAMVGAFGWFVVIRPVGTVLGPMLCKWFIAPAERVKADHKARRAAKLAEQAEQEARARAARIRTEKERAERTNTETLAQAFRRGRS
jgi:hypothetical protein